MRELILFGNVQGVACRYYCVENARHIGIRASASNLIDGSVKVVLETDDDLKVRLFIKNLRENPYGIRFWGSIANIKVR